MDHPAAEPHRSHQNAETRTDASGGASDQEPPKQRTVFARTAPIVGGAAAFASGFVAVVDLIDYTVRDTGFLLISTAIIAVTILLIVAGTRLKISQKDALAAIAVFTLCALGTWVVVTHPPNLSLDGIEDSCNSILVETNDPPRLRDCQLIVFGANSIDLDSRDPGWGTPDTTEQKGADIVPLQFDLLGAKAIKPVSFAAVRDAASYETCRRASAWSATISPEPGDKFCVITSEQRRALLIIRSVKERRDIGVRRAGTGQLSAYAIVWDIPGPEPGGGN